MNGRKLPKIIVGLILLTLFCAQSGLAQQKQIPSNQPCTAEAKPLGRKAKSKERRAKSEVRSAKGQEQRAKSKQAKTGDSIGICTVPGKG